MIAVTGATGFLGLHFIQSLHERGLHFVCLVRPHSPRLEPVKNAVAGLGQIREIDFESIPDLENALRGSDTLVHCMGLINGTEEVLTRVNVRYTENLVRAAKAAGITKFIFVSSVAAIRCHGFYGRTKFQAEEILGHSGLPYTILRPAYIYGAGDRNNTQLMLKTLKKFPLVPVLGGGGFRLQPVYVADVVRLLIQCLEKPALNQAFSVAGPEQIRLLEMLEVFSHALGLRRGFLPIPLKPVQAALRLYIRFFKNTKLPVKQILEMDRHEAFDISLTAREFNFRPLSFREGVERMFGGVPCAA